MRYWSIQEVDSKFYVELCIGVEVIGQIGPFNTKSAAQEAGDIIVRWME